MPVEKIQPPVIKEVLSTISVKEVMIEGETEPVIILDNAGKLSQVKVLELLQTGEQIIMMFLKSQN